MQLARLPLDAEIDDHWRILLGNVDEPKASLNDAFTPEPTGASGGPLDREPGCEPDEPDPPSNGVPQAGGLIGKPEPKREKKPKPAPRGDLMDNEGQAVPTRCRDAWADAGLRNLIEEQIASAETCLNAKSWVERASRYCDHYPFILITDFRDHAYEALRHLQIAKEMLEAGLPHAVCPRCNGAERKTPCQSCRGSGLVPEHRWSELKRESL